MISTSIILSTGEKKCTPMKFSGFGDVSASEVIGRVEVLLAKTTSGPSTACAFFVASALTAAVLEHRFDHEVAALERGVVGGRRDAGEQRLLVGRLGAALGDQRR